MLIVKWSRTKWYTIHQHTKHTSPIRIAIHTVENTGSETISLLFYRIDMFRLDDYPQRIEVNIISFFKITL